MEVVGEAGDVPGALRPVKTERPVVLVLDLNMPGPPAYRRWPRSRTAARS
jgi:DNA-binding NarL/FixJ family response regulator